MNIFDKLNNFSRTEKNVFGKPAFYDAKTMNPATLLILDALRDVYGHPVIIHASNEKNGHTKDSQHYVNNALDYHVENMNFIKAIDLTLSFLTKWAFIDKPLLEYCGLGIYPDWNTPGFHIDFRGYRASWGRIGKEYVSFDKAYLHALEIDKQS